MNASSADAFAQRLRAAQGRVSRELVRELVALGSEGRALLERHHAQLREKKDEDGALVVLSALALFDRLSGRAVVRDPRRPIPRALEGSVLAGRLVEPRRDAAFAALRARADTWARARSGAFVEGLDRLGAKKAGVEALVGEETIEREAPKVGRNDPCPCGSGKKFKKCCEKAPSPSPPAAGRPAARDPNAIAEVVRRVRWTEELYALPPDRQLELVGEPLFREHLALLEQAERPRSAPRDDPYLALAVLARVFQSRTSPSWARELALGLLRGPSHPALDRGALVGWLIESDQAPAARAATAAEVAPLVASEPLTLEGAVAAGLALVDAGAPAAALEAAARAATPDDPRLALVRFLAALALDRVDLAREAGSALEAALVAPDAELLRTAVAEARRGLDDPREPDEPSENDEPLVEDREPPGDEPLDEGRAESDDLAAPVSRTAATRDATATEASAPVAPPPPERPRAPSLPRRSALVDEALARTIAELAEARRAARDETATRVDQARRDHDEARAQVRALERELEKARERAERAKRTHQRSEHELAALDRPGVGPDLAAVAKALAEAHEQLDALEVEPWRRPGEVTVPVLGGFTRDAALLVVPVRADDWLAARAATAIATIAHAVVACSADVATQSEQPEETVRAASVLGFVGVLSRAPLARYRERSELWALALDDFFGPLTVGGASRLAPVLVPLGEDPGRALVAAAQVVDPPALPPHETPVPGEPLALDAAAALLGFSGFELARALGARALWESTGTVSPGALETLRLLERRAKPALPRHDEAEHDAGEDLVEDTKPARRALRTVLRRLVRFGKIGASHTRVDNALRGVPPHLRGTIKDAVDALIAAGVFRAKPTLNGLHISIEPTRIRDVDHFVLTGDPPWPRVASILG